MNKRLVVAVCGLAVAGSIGLAAADSTGASPAATHSAVSTAVRAQDYVNGALSVRFLRDWNGTDGTSYHAGDEVQLPVDVAYDLRSRGVADPVDPADPQWAQWE